MVREGIISSTDTQNIYANIKGTEVLSILYYIYQNYSKCSFSFDYDCDGIPNTKDNCPYDRNPNQYDLDGDGVGNVCDEDINGDGIKNTIGVVDDNNNIIISKRNTSQDKNPLGKQKEGF